MRCALMKRRDEEDGEDEGEDEIDQPTTSTNHHTMTTSANATNNNTPIVGEECARRAMALACAALVDNLGFSHCTSTSLDTLSSLSIRYLEKFCLQLHNFTQQGGRNRATINDGQEAFRKMRCDMAEITDYVNSTVQTRRTREPPLFPIVGSTSTKGFSRNEESIYVDEKDLFIDEKTLDHIPQWTPPIYKKEITLEMLEMRRRSKEAAATLLRQQQELRQRRIDEAEKEEKEANRDNFPDFLQKDLYSLGLYREVRKLPSPPFRHKLHQPLSIVVNETPQYASELLHHTVLKGESTASPRAPVLRLKLRKSDSCDVSSLISSNSPSPFSPLTPTSAPVTFNQRDLLVNANNRDGQFVERTAASKRDQILVTTNSPNPSILPSPLPSPFQIPALPLKKRGRPPKKHLIQAKKQSAIKKELPQSPFTFASEDQNAFPGVEVKDEVQKEKTKVAMPRRIPTPLHSPMVLPERSTRAQKPRALSPPPPASPQITGTRRKSQPFSPITPTTTTTSIQPSGKSLPPFPRTPLNANFNQQQQSLLHTTSSPLVSPITPTAGGYNLPRRRHQPPKKYLDFESDLPPSLGGRKRAAIPFDSINSPRITQPPNKKSKQQKHRLSLPAKAANPPQQRKSSVGKPASRVESMNRRVSLPAMSYEREKEKGGMIVPPLRLSIPRHTIDHIEEEEEEMSDDGEGELSEADQQKERDDGMQLDQGDLVEENGDSIEDEEEEEEMAASVYRGGGPLKLRISFGGPTRDTTIDDPTLVSPEPRMAIEIDVDTKNETDGGEEDVEEEANHGEEERKKEAIVAEIVDDDGMDDLNKISPSIDQTLDELLERIE